MATYHLADQKVGERTGDSGSNLTVTAAKPDNLAEGDLIVLRFSSSNVTSNRSGPAGFTLQQSYTSSNITLFRPHVLIYTKVADASEPADYTVTFDQSADGGAQRLVAGRVSAHNGVAGGNSGGSGSTRTASFTLAGVTVADDGTLRLSIFGSDSSLDSGDDLEVSAPVGVTVHDKRNFNLGSSRDPTSLSGGDDVDSGTAPDMVVDSFQDGVAESSRIAGAYITIAPGETGVTLTLPSVL